MPQQSERLRDEILILACREGDAEAFRALVSRWQEPLWRHAFRLTGRDDAAWDVLQESWMSMARDIARLADPSRFRRWAYTIVTRRAADWARRQPDGAVSVDDVETLAAVAAEPSDAVELLRAALRELPRAQRVLLSLRHVDGFDGVELAEILGVPEGTVKSRLFHARRKLRDIIERMQR